MGLYNKLINNNILQTPQPSPLLSPERSAILANIKKATFSQRGGSVVAHTETNINHEFNDRLLMVESALDKEMGHDQLFPKLLNVVSQDNLLD